MSQFKKVAFGTAFLVLSCSSALLAQWIEQSFPTSETLFRVRFIDTMTGWILADDFIYKTSDGGETWVAQDTSLGSGFALSALNADVAFYANCVNSQPKTRGIRRTIDGGVTWQTVDSTQVYYTEFEFVNEETGYAAGGELDFNALIRKTTDGGQTWTTVADDFSPSNLELEGISFIDEMRGWAVTYDAFIFNTLDGGTTWTLQDSIRPEPNWFPLRDIEFTTPDSGWVIGGISGTMVMARTTDGGENWSAVFEGGSSLRELTFLNSQVGWFCGSNNSPPFIARTTDGGVNWELQTFNTITNFGVESISIIDENLGWSVGREGHIYKFSNDAVSVDDDRESRKPLPRQFVLEQNYPNPFNPETTISYILERNSTVTLTIFDVNGRLVRSLVDEAQAAGEHRSHWDGRSDRGKAVGSGVYYYRLTAAGHTETRKMLLVR